MFSSCGTISAAHTLSFKSKNIAFRNCCPVSLDYLIRKHTGPQKLRFQYFLIFYFLHKVFICV